MPANEAIPAIQFDNVSLTFPGAEHPAVDRCSFDIAPGQLTVILGASGCGKTTLMKMVNRLVEPTSGRISLHGKDIRSLPVTQLRQHIGYAIQQTGLFPHMTVAQNVAVVPQLLGWSRSRINDRVTELLQLVELPAREFGDRFPTQLSGGQQQRVGVARALAGDPDVMLMDEPFGAIDAITRTSLQDELLRLQQRLKKTILFVSHDVDEALRLADRILILDKGRVVQFDTPLQILTNPANAFVRDLVSADDTVRQLGLMQVKTAMKKAASDRLSTQTTITSHDTLRQALSQLLRTGAMHLTVMEGERAIGTVSLDGIRAAAKGDIEE